MKEECQTKSLTTKEIKDIIVGILNSKPDEQSALNAIKDELGNAFRSVIRWDAYPKKGFRFRVTASDSERFSDTEICISNPFENWTSFRIRDAIQSICSKYGVSGMEEAISKVKKLDYFQYTTHAGEPFTTHWFVVTLPNYDHSAFAWDFNSGKIVGEKLLREPWCHSLHPDWSSMGYEEVVS